MGLETGSWIEDLVDTNPLGSDPKSQGDDHIRLIKKVVQDTFPNAGKAFDMNVIEDAVNVNSAKSNRNLLVNGSMQVWQRGITFNNLASGEFTSDRWRQETLGATVDVDQVLNTDNASKWALQLVGNGGNTRIDVIQRIVSEDSAPLVANQVTVTMRVKTSSPNTIQIRLASADTDNDFSNTTPVENSTNFATAGTVWEEFTFTFASLPTAVENGLEVRLRTGAAAGVSVQITNVQLEVGPSATSFEDLGIANEANRCLIYFERVVVDDPGAGLNPLLTGMATSSTSAIGTQIFTVKRVGDPVVTVSLGVLNFTDISAQPLAGAAVPALVSENFVGWLVSGTPGFVTGSASLCGAPAGTTTHIDISAEV